MEYFVVTDLPKGIRCLKLKPGTDFTGQTAYYINLEDPHDSHEEYFNLEQVFEDYDEALAAFCNRCAAKLNQLKSEITAIEQIKNHVLES